MRGLLEPRSSRLRQAMIMPLQSSLGDRVRPCLLKNKNKNKQKKPKTKTKGPQMFSLPANLSSTSAPFCSLPVSSLYILIYSHSFNYYLYVNGSQSVSIALQLLAHFKLTTKLYLSHTRSIVNSNSTWAQMIHHLTSYSHILLTPSHILLHHPASYLPTIPHLPHTGLLLPLNVHLHPLRSLASS